MNAQPKVLHTIIALLAFLLFAPLRAETAPQLEYLSDDIFIETGSKIMWQTTHSRRFKEQEDVQDYLQGLNSTGGHPDWRLPTKQELYNLHTIFDLKNNGSVKTRMEAKYWYADDTGTPQIGSWEIGDQCGPTRTFYSGKAGVVRAVRP